MSDQCVSCEYLTRALQTSRAREKAARHELNELKAKHAHERTAAAQQLARTEELLREQARVFSREGPSCFYATRTTL